MEGCGDVRLLERPDNRDSPPAPFKVVLINPYELGQVIAPPPEGASYLGFIFAHGSSPDAVESSLRTAHRRLDFEIQAEFPIIRAAR